MFVLVLVSGLFLTAAAWSVMGPDADTVSASLSRRRHLIVSFALFLSAVAFQLESGSLGPPRYLVWVGVLLVLIAAWIIGESRSIARRTGKRSTQ
ncbi:MAG: hypothetical protein Q7S84_04485 [bacterium]|nr:hypothetical protein [bacterium]